MCPNTHLTQNQIHCTYRFQNTNRNGLPWSWDPLPIIVIKVGWISTYIDDIIWVKLQEIGKAHIQGKQIQEKGFPLSSTL